MIKKIAPVVFGLLVVAGALASPALAVEYTTFETTTSSHVSGSITGEPEATHQVNATGSSEFGQVTCETTHATATTATGTETKLKVYTTTLNCHVVVGGTKFPVDFRMNECTLELIVTGGSGDSYTGAANILCPAGKVIEIEVTTAGGGTKKCLMTIASQTGLNNISFSNATGSSPTELTVSTASTNLKSTTSGGLLNCGVANGEHATGAYAGTTRYRAFNTSGTQVDLTLM